MTRAPAAAPAKAALASPILIACAMVIVLIGLGVWQVQRGQEKKALIAALAQRIDKAPGPLANSAEWPALNARDDEFRRVTLRVTFLPVPPALVFTSASTLRSDVTTTGYWVFAPARLASGETLIINRGFVPDQRKADAESGLPADRTVTLTGYLRFDEEPRLFTPNPDPARRLWYARASAQMAGALQWGRTPSFYIDMEAPQPEGAGPKPGALAPRLPDNHFQYAATWFALALIVVVLTGVWLRGQRRRKPGPDFL